jgi:hypothetical protein
MKKLELNQMENLHGGECMKTATKVLMASAAIVAGALTGGIGYLFMAWGLYTLPDTMTTCEEF